MIYKLRDKIETRINAEYQVRAGQLVSRAGIDRARDCEDRGFISAVKMFPVWVAEAIKELTGAADDSVASDIESDDPPSASLQSPYEEDL